MKRKIPCLCENIFTVEIPEEINLDESSGYIDELMDGSFMNYTCPNCGKKHKPEFPLMVLWPSRKLRIEALPEQERREFYRRKKDPEDTQTVIGYPELAERIAVFRDGLEPVIIETLKYYLLLKAQETYPEGEISIWYQRKSPAGIEFHLHGLKPGEAAVSQVPAAIYEKTLADYTKHPRGAVFTSLRVRSYLSIQNTMGPEDPK
ncbi:MAG: CpXC domain-containing protein [Treponema sp.]|jgi:hypothetical protein|nr:CpXC domain-containing protein [Treponema sp.]